jgi:hypothetical protein
VSNPNKQKGTRWESDIVAYLGAEGIPARRVAQSGQNDTGDIHGIDPFVGQAKSYRSIVDGIRDGVAGAKVQAARAGRAYGVAFVKRPGKGTGDAYAVMDLATFRRLLVDVRADAELADRYCDLAES